MHWLTLGILMTLVPSVYAATLDMDAFDNKRCVHWHMTSDTGGSTSRSYEVALKMAKQDPKLSVFSASSVDSSGRSVEKFGACEYKQYQGKFHCLPNQDYPFAGMAFGRAKQQNKKGVEVLNCASGCEDPVPDVIQVLSQDIVSEKEFAAMERMRRAEFRRACEVR